MKTVLLIQAIVLLLCLCHCNCKKHKSKYSEEANEVKPSEIPQPVEPVEKYDPDFRTIRKPYRMAKLNMVWSKAVHRLTEPKLKSLFTELKIQDKEELNWKQLGGQHKDKDGLKEAELRQKLIGIMSTYGLLEHFDDTQDPEKYKHHKAYSGRVEKTNYQNKSLFKDKKLNKLWEKAEVSGFTPEELNALKEEFMHHQDKVDLYYTLLDNVNNGRDKHQNAVNEDEQENFNEIEAEESNDVEVNPNDKNNNYLNDANLLRAKHQEIRDNYDRLERVAARGPNSQDFIEPKVQGLWKMAASSNFSATELASLKVELLHYESRLLKLRHLHAENALNREKYKEAHHGPKHDKYASMDEHIKKQSRKVEKLQEHLEEKIYKHMEL